MRSGESAALHEAQLSIAREHGLPGWPALCRLVGQQMPAQSWVLLHVYRIVQEALTNARRHAPITDVRVLLEYRTESLRITVANGTRRGPDSRAVQGRDHGQDPRDEATAGTRASHRPGPARAGTSGTAEPLAGGDAVPGPGAGTGTGHGLIGMRERATALRGTVTAGPDPVGGYQVRAELPLPSASPSAPGEPAPALPPPATSPR